MSTSPGQYSVQLPDGEDLLVELQFDGGEYVARVGGELHRVSIRSAPGGILEVVIDDQIFQLLGQNGSTRLAGALGDTSLHGLSARDAGVEQLKRAAATDVISSAARQREVLSPLTGLVIDCCVAEGQIVEVGATLLVIEAMKMENRITAPCEGRVVTMSTQIGETVRIHDPLVSILPR